ncbi:MAG: XTP/dITP diphosphatase [Armatimonadota bacterium]|nr:XTP/dITP diphosphatase [bacterium]
MRKLVVATKNPGKAKEVAEILVGLPYEVVSLAQYSDAPDVEETGTTFVENAVLKAKAYAEFTGELTLADDSGLEVDALDGAPGVYSSRFAPTDAERISKLLDVMKDVPDERRTARFCCAVAIAEPGGEARTCEGKVEGTIAHEPRGDNGFGYDPIFQVTSLNKRMAELESSEKNAISHRGKALEQAKKLLLGTQCDG